MSYPQPTAKYERDNEARFRSQAAQDDARNHKRLRDIEIGKGCRAIFVDEATGGRVAMSISGGVVTLTSV